MSNSVNTINKNDCCGCGSCFKKCPVGAISLKKDELGFIYPCLANEKCIDCGACYSICPAVSSNSEKVKNDICKKIFASQSNNSELLIQSASGGAFSTIAYSFLESGGVVYGASWDASFNLHHKRITTTLELPQLLGSKYTQSSIIECFKQLKEDLESNILVLFSGTPCQIAAVKLFLTKEYNNLYTIDLICHGVGSPDMLQTELHYFEDRYQEKITSISFRSKDRGWGTAGKLEFITKSISFNQIVSPYYYYYLASAIFRDSCYGCKYASKNRVGDITIGDYWGVESALHKANFNFKVGVSCVLINTGKGSELINKFGSQMTKIESNIDELSKRNRQLIQPSQNNPCRDEILASYFAFKNNYYNFVEYFKKREKKNISKLRYREMVPFWLKSFLKRFKKQ